MKLSELSNEKAIEVFGEILEPACRIIGDKTLADMLKGNKAKKIEKASRIDIIKYITKNHPKDIVEILARLDGEEPENYKVNVVTLPLKILELFNDPDLKDLFTLQGQITELTPSGSATENTGADGN